MSVVETNEDQVAVIRHTAKQLAKSDVGRRTLQVLQGWFDGPGLSLDALNQSRVMTLLHGAWTSHPGTVRDAIDAALQS